MQTRIIHWDKSTGFKKEELAIAAKELRSGRLVAFPTETVYGLGADGLNPKAVRKIYRAKGRPGDNPLILHIANRAVLDVIAKNITPVAEKLIETFWPGPMTLIFEKSDIVPKEVTGGLDTVAVRMPAHSGAIAFIEEVGVPVAAPSANLSGKPSPTSAKHVIDDLEGRVDVIIDGGEVGIGYESTIIDITGEKPCILRPGFITRKMIEEVIGETDVDEPVSGRTDFHPKAPGMKYRHYAPEADMVLVRGNDDEVIEKINSLAAKHDIKKVGILTTEEHKDRFPHGIIATVGSNRDNTVGQKLYSALRMFDNIGVEIIYSETFLDCGHSDAVLNRLLKAAGGNVIDLEEYHRVIFVCRENVTISPMAEVIFSGLSSGYGREVLSRGLVVLFPEPVNEKVVSLLEDHGFECRYKNATPFDPAEVDEHTLVLAMSFAEKIKLIEDYSLDSGNVYTIKEYVGETDDVFDPYGGGDDAYEKLYEELRELVDKLLKKIGW